MDRQTIVEFILFFPGFLFSLAWHEAAHGYIANKLGDNTAQRLGRVTLNPIPHMDPIGTVLLPTVGFFSGFLIGWGVPVPVDYRNFKNPKKDTLYVALAGPVSNLILAVLISLVIRGMIAANPDWINADLNYNGHTLLSSVINILFLNLALAFFNLIPIHPLDGGKILYGLLPYPYSEKFDRFVTQYGFILLLGLFLSGAFKILILPPMKFLGSLLLKGI